MTDMITKIYTQIKHVRSFLTHEDSHEAMDDIVNLLQSQKETIESMRCCGNCNNYSLDKCYKRDTHAVDVCGDEKCKSWVMVIE